MTASCVVFTRSAVRRRNKSAMGRVSGQERESVSVKLVRHVRLSSLQARAPYVAGNPHHRPSDGRAVCVLPQPTPASFQAIAAAFQLWLEGKLQRKRKDRRQPRSAALQSCRTLPIASSDGRPNVGGPRPGSRSLTVSGAGWNDRRPDSQSLRYLPGRHLRGCCRQYVRYFGLRPAACRSADGLASRARALVLL